MRLQRTTLALLVAALAPQWALAADDPVASSQAQPQDQPQDDATTLDRVVVTGEKLGRTADETVSSVAIREGWQIDATPARTVEDVIGHMANVGTARELTIRGISVFGPTDGDGTTITLSVDGIAQESWATRVDSLSVWDLDRIEVLRGPQSTNQGRSALAGAVVAHTKDPTSFWDFHSRISSGSNDSWTAAAAGGGPLVDGRLAFRISGELTGTDGEIHNLTQDDDRWDFDRRDTWRAKLAWTPFDNDYRALLTVVDEQHRYGHEYVEYTSVDPRDRVSLANLGLPSDTHKQNLALEQTFGWKGLDVTLLTSLADVRWERPQRDYDETELDQGASSHHGDDDIFSQEVRAAFDTPLFGHPLKGMAGVYYRSQPGFSYDNFKVPVSYVLGLFGMCDTQAACDAEYAGQFILREDDEDIRIHNRAAFAEVDWNVGRYTYTLGARRDLESQRRVNNSTTSGNTPTAVVLLNQLIEFGVLSPDGQVNTEVDYAAWLPKVGIRRDMGGDWMLGAQWQRGYRTGGIVHSYQRGPVPFGPEYTDNLDVSLKGPIGERLQFAATVYRIDWRDQQVDIGNNSLDRYIVNAGRSRLRGMELELGGALTDTLGFNAGIGLNRSEYLAFDSPMGDFAGNEFPMSPRHTASLRVNWHPGPWTVDAGVRREGGTWSDAGNDPALRNDQVTLFDLKASYQFDNGLRAFAYGTNLTDEFYTTWVFATASDRQAASLGRGRHVGMGLEWQY